MKMAAFAAAQQRVLERRQQINAEARAQQLSARETPATGKIAGLTFPFLGLGGLGHEAWDAINGRSGTRPAFRVGQVDAELLDEELLGLLKGQVGEALKYFGVCRHVQMAVFG